MQLRCLMTPDSSGRSLLLAMGEAGPGRLTDGCGYCSYWAPSIRAGHRGWQELGHSPVLPIPLPIPAANPTGPGTAGNCLGWLRGGAHWAPKCSSTAWSGGRHQQRTVGSGMVWVGWILNPSRFCPCHGQGHLAHTKPHPSLVQVVTHSIPWFFLLKKQYPAFLMHFNILHAGSFSYQGSLGGGSRGAPLAHPAVSSKWELQPPAHPHVQPSMCPCTGSLLQKQTPFQASYG